MNILIQLFLLSVLVLFAAVLGTVIYRIIHDVLDTAKSKLAKHNVTMTSSGASIGVKKRDREGYLDDVQKQVVNAWNKASTPGYKGSWLFGAPKAPSGGAVTKASQEQKKQA